MVVTYGNKNGSHIIINIYVNKRVLICDVCFINLMSFLHLVLLSWLRPFMSRSSFMSRALKLFRKHSRSTGSILVIWMFCFTMVEILSPNVGVWQDSWLYRSDLTLLRPSTMWQGLDLHWGLLLATCLELTFMLYLSGRGLSHYMMRDLSSDTNQTALLGDIQFCW